LVLVAPGRLATTQHQADLILQLALLPLQLVVVVQLLVGGHYLLKLQLVADLVVVVDMLREMVRRVLQVKVMLEELVIMRQDLVAAADLELLE
jgi:hypothetical protein